MGDRHTGGIRGGIRSRTLQALAQKKEAVKVRQNMVPGLMILALSGCMAAWSPAAEREHVRYVEKIYLADTDEPEEQKPGFDNLIRLADCFQVSLDYLAGRSETRAIPP